MADPNDAARRRLLTRSAWAFLWSSAGVSLAATLRLLFPRVRFVPPSVVVVGRSEEFPVGMVSEKWKKSHGVIVVRNETGFYALHSRCTHLGCVPGWSPEHRKFKCPCHGSGFRVGGENFEGPAPRALERMRIFLDDEGRIAVDTAVRLRKERGDWERPDAFLAQAGIAEGKHGRA
jgi:cytochrome b6-f complex iron-sulfur subunit